jgi:poly-gamma-glutamate synthesis protein (capsule biosynthesis protein)
MSQKINSKIKAKIKLLFWAVFPVVLGISLASFILLVFKNIDSERIIEPKDNSAIVIQSLTAGKETRDIISEKKSQYFYVNKDTNGQPKISAEAFLVGDLNTGEVILAKNQDKKFPIASISKLMTALVTSLIMTPEDIAQVSKKALETEGKNGSLKIGEKIKISDLLYPLLLESSNDAAEVLAEYFTRDSFIAKMNQEVEKLKMTSTSFEDPSGLSQNNQSTVSDIFKFAGYLTQQKSDLLKITTERSFSNKKHSWSNISQFLGEDSYFGGKSGYTDPAKQTVVSLFSLPLGKSGFRPIAITLFQSSDRYKDVESILKYLKKNIYYGGEADANTNWVQEKIGMPDIKDPNFVTLAFAGDLMLDRGVKNSVRKNFNNDYSALFEKSKELLDILKKSDITFANLEGTASDKGADLKNLYSFRMDPEVIPSLKGAGISILSVANNHIGDWGRLAFVDTLPRLKENEILYTGGGQNEIEAETPAIIEKYGMKIGFLGFSDKGPDYMAADTDKAGILLANNPDFDKIIKNATKQVDYLVVTFHFGEEYQTKHNARQEYLAHRAVDDGAKIIIGSHPHVIEDTEVYKNSFIAYSLGNFIFDQSWSKPTMQGMLLEIKLNRDGSMTAKKDTLQLNSAFQPDKIIKGQEEKIKFQEIKTTL